MLIALLILALLSSSLPVMTMAESSAVILPESMQEIQEEAFAGDHTIQSIVIPKTVQRIGSKAFSECTGLTEVYFGNNVDTEIAEDAFEGCGDIHFYAYPGTSAELFALSHGYECDLLEEGSSFLERAFQLVSSHGGTSSILQSAEFAAMRLIVRVPGNKLPDISEYRPTEILRADDGIFFVQFDSVEATTNCYTMLCEDESVIFVEPDACVEVIDEMESAGTVYGKVWDTEDPMGFEVYAPFVAANSSRRVTIAVIDSGVERRSAYNSILRADGISLVAGEPDWDNDGMQHGSMITGIIKDCVGDANVDVLPVRVVSRSGVASLTMIALGIQYALEHGADVINLSLNFEANKYVTYWLKKALAAGVDVVVAAGNSSRNIAKVYPANVPGVITVSGIDSDYELSAGSNYGDNISYCAPDTDVQCSAYSSVRRQGTSFAAPMVAAALALVDIDIYHTRADLRASCRQLQPAVGGQNNYGNGLMQLDKLASISADSVQIDSAISKQMAVGKTQKLEWSVFPENTTDKSVTVTSSDSNVLKVETQEDSSVILQALAKGTATITVNVDNQDDEEYISDSVTISVVQPVERISISAPKTRLAMGRTMQVSVESILPSSADNQAYTWQLSSQGGGATISDSGVITPTKLGIISVSALAQDGYDAVSNVIEIEIIDIPDAEEVVLTEKSGIDISSGSIRLAPGDILSLNASVLPEEADQIIKWSCSSSPEGAVILDSNGNVQAVQAGSAVVTATSENGITARLSISVAILPTGISISGNTTDGTVIMDIGATENLSLSFRPSNTTEQGVVWISANTSVAQVDQNGVVTGIAPGSANIIAISNAVNSVTAAITVTVRQPYTLSYNANGGSVSVASKTAYSGYAVGELPTPSRDYHIFDGWYTAASGGDRVVSSSTLTASDTYTIYAHWTLKQVSDWVLPSSVPSGASIVERKTETTTSTSSSLSGWTKTGESWNQTGSGSVDYASFPSGFDTGNWYYSNIKKSALEGWNNGSTKRDVNNSWSGYVYWHWMYNTNSANGTSTRAIYNQKGTGPDNGYYYYLFGAFTSSNGNYSSDTYYCNSRGIRNYIIPERTAFADCQGATRWFRFDYYTSYYTDYQKVYSFSRELVRYREK